MASKRAFNKVASREAGLKEACQAAAKLIHEIIAVVTACFDCLEFRVFRSLQTKRASGAKQKHKTHKRTKERHKGSRASCTEMLAQDL